MLEYVGVKLLPKFEKLQAAEPVGAAQQSDVKLAILRMFAELALNAGKPDSLETILLHVFDALKVLLSAGPMYRYDQIKQ